MKLSVKIKPAARENKILGWEQEVLKIAIKAPPQDGAANKELIRFLAKALKITQADITLVSGTTNKNKIIELPDDCDLQRLRHF